MKFEINEPKLKASARILRELLGEQSGCVISHQQSLQVLSKALFSKTYEEVKATLLTETTESSAVLATTAAFKAVLILEYGSESILVSDGEYVGCCAPGTDLQVPRRVLEDQADREVRRLGQTKWRAVALPEILGEEWEIDEVLALAERMGYLKYPETIFDVLQTDDIVIFIDGRHCKYGLNGDALDSLTSAVDNEEDPYNVCVWFAETSEEYDLYEYFLDFGQLCRATTEDGKNWLVTNEDSPDCINIRFTR